MLLNTKMQEIPEITFKPEFSNIHTPEQLTIWISTKLSLIIKQQSSRKIIDEVIGITLEALFVLFGG